MTCGCELLRYVFAPDWQVLLVVITMGALSWVLGRQRRR